MGVLYPSENPSGEPKLDTGLEKPSSVAIDLERVLELLEEEVFLFLQLLRLSLELLTEKSSSHPDLSSIACSDEK
jgi:hypothetical protein